MHEKAINAKTLKARKMSKAWNSAEIPPIPDGPLSKPSTVDKGKSRNAERAETARRRRSSLFKNGIGNMVKNQTIKTTQNIDLVSDNGASSNKNFNTFGSSQNHQMVAQKGHMVCERRKRAFRINSLNSVATCHIEQPIFFKIKSPYGENVVSFFYCTEIWSATIKLFFL